MRFSLFLSERLFQGVPVLFRRGERVVSVPYREEKGSLVPVFFLHSFGRNERGEHLRNLFVFGDKISFEMPAAHIEIEIVYLPVLRARGVQFFVDRTAFVVIEEHNVRKLRGRVPADFEPGRNALRDRSLGGAHERAAAGRIIVGFKVHRRRQPDPPRRIRRGAHDEDIPRRRFAENALFEICFHLLRRFRREFGLAGKVNFGKDDPQRGGLFPHERVEFLPVFFFRSELVARDDRPRAEIHSLSGEQEFRRP